MSTTTPKDDTKANEPKAENGTSESTPTPSLNMEESIAKAERALALRKYEEAVQHYATALELAVEKYGDQADETADLYFSYGKALLENAISQSAVLGKEQAEDALLKDGANGQNGAASADSKAFISFSGDAEEEDDDEDNEAAEDPAVDLFSAAAAEEGKDGDEGEEEEGEPEDDFNAAWEVLDLARLNYEKRKDESDEIKLKLAETYVALGDVSLETEKLDLAIDDFEEALKLKSELLPLSSRQLAEAHYKLSIVLDLTSGRLSQAIHHAEKALDSVDARLAELRNAQNGQMPPLPEASNLVDKKGKGKAVAPLLAPKELVQNMTKAQIDAEIKDLEGLREELALKVEEIKTTPAATGVTEKLDAPALAQKALDLELGVGAAKSREAAVVNNLTVKKKKPKATEATENGKRKAEDEVPAETKKAKVDVTERV